MYTPFRNRSEQRESRRRALALGVVSSAAAAGFGVLASAAARRDTAQTDEQVRKQAAAPAQHPARRAAEAIAPLGKWWAYLPAVLAACIYVLGAPRGRKRRARSGRRAGAGAMLLAGTTATALGPVFDRWLPQPPAPPGHKSRRKPVFPSGHTFGPIAVSLTTAYVLSREGLARPEIAAPVALMVPAVTASGKLLGQKHWASDVLGGYLGGTAVAAAWLSAYEAVRGSKKMHG